MLSILPRSVVTLVAVLSVAAGLRAQVDHTVAMVNDPRSHGQVGDALLSLNEVILLNKRALNSTALSAQEAAQITGFGTDVATADIDFTVVPKITCERDFDSIENTAHGMIVTGSNGTPTIDLAGTRGFLANSDFADFRNLVMENAAVAITLNQDSALFGTVVNNVTFRNISSTALLATMATSNAPTRLQVEESVFLSVPTAVEVFDTGANRIGSLWFIDSEIQGGTNGVVVHLGPGGALNVKIDTSTITGTQNGIVFDRPTAVDTRQLALSSLHLTVRGAATAFSFEGHASVADQLTLRMSDLAGQTNALRLWPVGTRLQATVEDGRLDGGAELLTGTGTGILAANLRMKNGSLVAGSNGAPVRITDTILEQVTTSTQGTARVTLDAARFMGGSVQGSVTAPLDVVGCHLGGATVGANAVVSGSLPAPQLGSMDVAPLQPRIGTSTTLQADLPPNLNGLWFFGLAETLPFYGPRPLHLYFWLQFVVVLPVAVTGQSQLVVPIPNDPTLTVSGLDAWVVQLAVLPSPGLSAPPLSIPPGRRLVMR